jgi:hypothetical protein
MNRVEIVEFNNKLMKIIDTVFESKFFLITRHLIATTKYNYRNRKAYEKLEILKDQVKKDVKKEIEKEILEMLDLRWAK